MMAVTIKLSAIALLMVPAALTKRSVYYCVMYAVAREEEGHRKVHHGKKL